MTSSPSSRILKTNEFVVVQAIYSDDLDKLDEVWIGRLIADFNCATSRFMKVQWYCAQNKSSSSSSSSLALLFTQPHIKDTKVLPERVYRKRLLYSFPALHRHTHCLPSQVIEFCTKHIKRNQYKSPTTTTTKHSQTKTKTNTKTTKTPPPQPKTEYIYTPEYDEVKEYEIDCILKDIKSKARTYNNGFRIWTPEELSLLKQFLVDQCSVDYIMHRLGRTWTSLSKLRYETEPIIVDSTYHSKRNPNSTSICKKRKLSEFDDNNDYDNILFNKKIKQEVKSNNNNNGNIIAAEALMLLLLS